MKMVTYCGLYCDLCSQRARIPELAKNLKDILTKEGFEFWGKEVAGSEQFWEFLGNLSDTNKSCPGCRQGGGNPDCDLRKCAIEKGAEICCLCKEFPCERINDFSKVYPTVISDGQRLKEIGTDAWIEEQKARKKTGFAYCDIRNPYPEQ